MKLTEFKKKVQGCTQVTITHYPINGLPVTSRREVKSITDQGIHTLLSWEPHAPTFIDWPSPKHMGHRISGNSLTWISRSGTRLFTYHFPLSVEEAMPDK